MIKKFGEYITESSENKSERIQFLMEADEMIHDAIEKIREGLEGTPFYAHAQSYIIPHLLTWVGEGNPYDHSIDKYIEDLREWDGITESVDIKEAVASGLEKETILHILKLKVEEAMKEATPMMFKDSNDKKSYHRGKTEAFKEVLEIIKGFEK